MIFTTTVMKCETKFDGLPYVVRISNHIHTTLQSCLCVSIAFVQPGIQFLG